MLLNTQKLVYNWEKILFTSKPILAEFTSTLIMIGLGHETKKGVDISVTYKGERKHFAVLDKIMR